MPVRRSRLLAAGLIVPALALAACGDDEDAASIEVASAWARTSPMMAEAGAAYMQISSEETTSVVGASVDPSVAGSVELHETVMGGDMAMDDDMATEDDDEHDHDDGEHDHGDGEMAMTMQQVSAIDVPAGETVSLEPGGLHVMLLDLPDPLEAGEEFDITLTLEDGEEVVVGVEVRDEAP
ncbi:MAG: copper chaperone PCu(A)C [Actinomycetota bacterium]